MSIPNAAIAAGYPRSLVDKHTKNLPVPTVGAGSSTDFFALFEQKRMTDKKKVEHAIAGMNAMKTIVVDKEEHQVPDWQARHKYFETMLKLCKQLEKTEASSLHLHLGGDFATRLRNARERSTEEMKNSLLKKEATDGQYTPAAPRRKKVETVDVTAEKVEEEACP